MNSYKRFRLIRDYECSDGTLLAGSDIDLLGDRILYNGGMIQPQYYSILMHIITDTELSKKYLREIPIPYNKL